MRTSLARVPRVAIPLPPISTRSARYAELMLRAISDELGTMAFVTREDLMQLRIFQSVSTITRYHEVCSAVHILLQSGRLTAMTRTDLVLPSQKGRYAAENDAADRYDAAIWKACRSFKKRPFSVMDVVGRWTTDQHLSLNAKRVAARNGLKRLQKTDRIEATEEFEYVCNELAA